MKNDLFYIFNFFLFIGFSFSDIKRKNKKYVFWTLEESVGKV